MIIIEFLNKAFLLVFSSSLIATSVLSFLKPSKQSANKSEDTKTAKESDVDENLRFGISILLFIATVTLVIVGIIFAIKEKQLWLFVICIAYTYLKCTTGAYRAVGVLGSIVRSNSDKKLSTRGYAAIEAIAYFVFFLCATNIFNRLIDWAMQYPNDIISDCMIAFLYVFLTFIYLFFILALLPNPLACCIKFLQKIAEKVPYKHSANKIGDFFVRYVYEEALPSNLKNPLSYRAVRYIKKATHKARWILSLLVPIIFIIDVLLLLLIVIFAFFLEAIGYAVILFRQIEMTVGQVATWILTLSNERVVAISFRLALIIALITIQVFNRYQPLFKIYDSSTAIFEFLASAILIPIILEWLYSAKKHVTKCE